MTEKYSERVKWITNVFSLLLTRSRISFFPPLSLILNEQTKIKILIRYFKFKIDIRYRLKIFANIPFNTLDENTKKNSLKFHFADRITAIAIPASRKF